MNEMTAVTGLTIMNCSECGVSYAMPERRRVECKQKGSTFYCVNGHAQYYTETKCGEVENRLKKARREIGRLSSELRTERNKRDAQLRWLITNVPGVGYSRAKAIVGAFGSIEKFIHERDPSNLYWGLKTVHGMSRRNAVQIRNRTAEALAEYADRSRVKQITAGEKGNG